MWKPQIVKCFYSSLQSIDAGWLEPRLTEILLTDWEGTQISQKLSHVFIKPFITDFGN